MPRVSVIVPVYNGERTIGDCVESIFALSFPRNDVELLLIDNASTDRTPTILDGYRDRAIILDEMKRGPSSARNRGLVHATGDIVAFTDADCVVHRDWLSQIVAPLRDPVVGIVGGTILARTPCNAVEEFGERIHDHRMAIEYSSPPYAITMNWASRKSVLEKVGPFDEDLLRCEDCDLAYRVVGAGYRIVHEPAAVVYHRNEQSLAGLIAEGYAHGYHSIPLLKKHAEFVRTFVSDSPSRSRPPTRKALPHEALYWQIFNCGKAAGRMIGSIREERSAQEAIG